MMRLAFLPVAVALTIVASLRASRIWPRLAVDEAVERLRTTRQLPQYLRRPQDLELVVFRLSRWLPPRGLRACLKRSLLLLDVWSRCGLRPELHLGVSGDGQSRSGHAWVTADSIDSGDMGRYHDAFHV
jgi:hypothetical protein